MQPTSDLVYHILIETLSNSFCNNLSDLAKWYAKSLGNEESVVNSKNYNFTTISHSGE